MRRLVSVIALWALVWAVFGASSASAADSEREGSTTGPAFVTNFYLWTGSATNWAELSVAYDIEVQPGSKALAQWTCNDHVAGRTAIVGNMGGWSGTISEANVPDVHIVNYVTTTYCAYHIWTEAGYPGGFRVTDSTVYFWNWPTSGGQGGGPTAPPPGTAAPGSTFAGSSPTPTPSPTPPPAGSWGNCYDDGGGVVQITSLLGTRVCLAGLDLGGTYPDGTTIHLSYQGHATANWPGNSKTGYMWLVCAATPEEMAATVATLGNNNAGTCNGNKGGTTSYTSDSSGGNTVHLAASNQLVTLSPSTRYVGLWARTNFTGGTWWTDQASYITSANDPSATAIPTPTPSPTPTASPTATPGPGACEPGTYWTGTQCDLIPPAPSWYPPFSSPLPTPSPGPNQGGSGGLLPGEHSPPNSNGLALCEADDGTYSKPGQAPLQPLADTSFPGSINPLDYIPWVGNMVANVPTVVSNTAQWGMNTTSDWIIPGPCVIDIVEGHLAEIQLEPPFSLFTLLSTELSAGSAGSMSLGAIPLPGGTTAALPMDSLATAGGTVRPILAAFVWILVAYSCIRLIVGTFGVQSSGGGE